MDNLLLKRYREYAHTEEACAILFVKKIWLNQKDIG